MSKNNFIYRTLVLILFSLFSFNYAQVRKDSIILEKGKYGLIYENKVILSPIYDSIENVDRGFLSIFYKNREGLLVNDEGVILAEKIKAIYKYKCDTVQIIKRNEMLFIDTKRKYPFGCYSIKEHFIVGDLAHDYKIGNEFIIVHSSGYVVDEYQSYNHTYNYLNRTKDHLFVNGTKELYYEPDGWYYKEVFRPLKAEYIICKKKGEYGVWDFKENKIILPFKYDKIIPNNSYMCLEKNGLKTFYPNIGTEPKYKKLERYIEYFARFETVDGRTGWVDRKGKEYFDE